MTFEQWQAYTAKVDGIAKRVKAMSDARALKLAQSVGIPDIGICLHNASIDDSLTGWCHNNPQRLKVAKRAIRIANDWRASRIATKISRKAWERIG